MKKIYEVLEGVYTNDSLRRTIVPLFVGNPGIGKTVIIDKFAKDKGVKIVELITSQMSPFEISGIAYPDKDSKKMEYYNFDKLENLVDGDILFFDELLNGNPVVLNACLTILEQRRFISGKPLPNIMIVAAANPQGMAPLTPQIKERFVWYDVKFNPAMWAEFMFNKYGLIKPIASKLSTLIQNEKDFNGNNFHTPRSIDKAVNMIIRGIPTPYEAVGMVKEVWVMYVAVIVTVIIMLFAAEPISNFVNKHPAFKILALSFLLLIGFSLIVDGFGKEIPKGYIYFAMAFSLLVNIIQMKTTKKSEPVHLHEHYKEEEQHLDKDVL